MTVHNASEKEANDILKSMRKECVYVIEPIPLTLNQDLHLTSQKLKIALYQSQRLIHTVAARAAPWAFGLSLIRRTINRNWHTNTVTHPSTNRSRYCLTQAHQAVGCSSMPRTTDYWNRKKIIPPFWISYMPMVGQVWIF